MPDLTTLEIFSYIANVVFITWGIATLFRGGKAKKEEANFFNAAYEMACRLADSLKDQHAKEQAQNLVSFLKAATRNLMNREYDAVGGKSRNPFVRWFERDANVERKKELNTKTK